MPLAGRWSGPLRGAFRAGLRGTTKGPNPQRRPGAGLLIRRGV